MLDILSTTEQIMPLLLEDETAWTGVFADTERPALHRLWRQLGERRVYLHRFPACAQGEAFFHPHPWPFAVRVLFGRYEMGLGASADPYVPPSEIAKIVLEPGSCYEMMHPGGWHWIRPIGAECYTLMVAGPLLWEKNRVRGNAPSRELTAEERQSLFAFARGTYR